MTEDFTLEEPLYLHSIQNPPAIDRSLNAEIVLANTSGLLHLKKIGSGFQTEYVLKIENPLQIGFTSASQVGLQRDLQNFVLAVNLTMSRLSAGLSPIGFTKPNIKFKPRHDVPAKVEVDEKGNKHITIREQVNIREEVSIMIGTQENLDEPITVSTFQRLQRFKRFNLSPQSTLFESNLAKALKEFEDAMNTFDRLAVFKHLYNAIELATNSDGSEDVGEVLDKKASSLTNTPQADLEVWRDHYNRTKHVDLKPEQVESYLKGRDSLPLEIVKVRACARTALLARLP